MATESQRPPDRAHDDNLDATQLAVRMESARLPDRKKDEKPFAPEAGILAILAAMAATWGLCAVMDYLLGPHGIFPALLGGLLIGRGARKLARKISEKYFEKVQ